MRHLIIETRKEGFFSNFNLIAGSLSCMYDNNIQEFNVLWKNPLYQNTDYNMFDKYFYKQKMYPDFNVVKSAHDLAVSMFQFVTPIEVFQKLNRIMNHYGCFDNEPFKAAKEKSIEKSNSLGVHVRRTDHARHGEFLNDEYYFLKIDENLNTGKYDNIFLATDDSSVVLKFKNRYGDRIFCNEDITRLNGNTGIHYSDQPNKEKLASDVMMDAASMAKCKKILITASNVAGYVLMVNPTIEYDQIDKHITFIH
jgi:hypothetical protein